MPEKRFNPKNTKYKIVSVPLVAYIEVEVLIDFDLKTQESEEYPEFLIHDEALKCARYFAPDWEISEDKPLELIED